MIARTMATFSVPDVQRRDEAAVDLDLLHRQPLQVGQRRVAGAEVVDREPHPELAQVVQHGDGPVGVGHDRALGDLQGQPVGRDVVPGEQAGDVGDEVGVLQAAGGEVHRDAEVVAGRPPASRTAASDGVEHLGRQAADEAAALGDRDELLGPDRAEHRVLPADERLDARDLAGAQPGLRLDVHLGASPCCTAVAQLRHQGQVVRLVGVQLGVVEPDPPGGGLGVGHRHVGALEQRTPGRWRASGAIATPTEAATSHLVPVERDGLLEGPQQAAGEVHGAVLVDGAGEQDGELVAAEPGDGAGRADDALEPEGDLHEQAVALLVPERLVDLLELVEVEDEDRGAGRRALGHRGQRGGEPALQVRAVGQAGEGVVQRVVPQLADELAVAQRDAGVVGDGLEQEGVVLVEGADVAEPVGDDERADDAGRPVERDDDGVAHPVLREPAPRLGHAGVPRHEQRRPLVDDLARAPSVSSGVAGSSDRDSRPAASSRTRATRSPSGPMNAAVARSERSTSLASPRTLFMTSSSSTELLTAWLNRYSRSRLRCRSARDA